LEDKILDLQISTFRSQLARASSRFAAPSSTSSLTPHTTRTRSQSALDSLKLNPALSWSRLTVELRLFQLHNKILLLRPKRLSQFRNGIQTWLRSTLKWRLPLQIDTTCGQPRIQQPRISMTRASSSAVNLPTEFRWSPPQMLQPAQQRWIARFLVKPSITSWS
jgi:hypothetical protein